MSVWKELDREIEQERQLLRKVIEIIYSLHKKAKKTQIRPMLSPRTLEDAIREEFDFTEIKCKDCARWLTKKEYTKDPSRRFGVLPYCSYCRAIREANYRKKNRDKLYQRQAKWKKQDREKHPEKYRKA